VLPSRRGRALALATFQAADLVATQVSPRYGPPHLDHLGVPRGLRPVLPVVKAGAVVALLATASSPAAAVIGAGLVAYYSAAVTFHVLSDDPPGDAAPAVACAALAASLVAVS